MKKKALFITSAPISANPRIVKELDFFKNNYECYLICHHPNGWTTELDKQWLAESQDIHTIHFSSHQNKLYWAFLRLLQKVVIVFKLFIRSGLILKLLASTPQAFLLKKTLKPWLKVDFDLVCLHTYTGMAAGALLKNYFKKSSWQIDVEDYHPGEKAYWNEQYESALRIELMQSVFNRANKITYAAPLMEKKCLEIFDFNEETKHQSILNSFPQSEFRDPIERNSDKIKCVWFSQHINHSRGLEAILQDIKNYPQIELHLIGVKHEAFLSQFDLGDNVKIHQPMPQKALHQFLAGMDIGLALEANSADENRQICLTNKILAYVQAGLYVYASDTLAQKDFLLSLVSESGKCSEEPSLCELFEIDECILEKDRKQIRFEFAKSISWEQESQKLFK